MKFALISDIHGNELALRAVLADIDRRGADLIVCLGDVATLGPRPEAVIELLVARDCPCILGNHDEFLLDEQLIHQYTEAPPIVAAVDWCRARLSAAELGFLATFRRELELPLDGVTNLLAFHGSPRSHLEELLATTPADELERRLDGRPQPVLAGGHTHIQMLRQHRGRLLLNPGSVGLPFREYVAGRPPTLLAHAEYATVEAVGGAIQTTLHRLPLDRDALSRAAAAVSDMPLSGMLVAQYAS